MAHAAGQPSVPLKKVESDRERPLLVGREREQGLLRQQLTRMLAGRGSLVLVSGEAGIGKTTLVDWLAVEAEQQGVLVLWGHAYDLSVTPPYGPWIELLSAYRRRDDLPPLPSFVGDLEATAALGSQERLFATARDFLGAVAARQPLALILEDLHWADQASLDFLRVLARQLAHHRLLLVASYRSDELHRRHSLYTLLPLLVREAQTSQLELRPLNEGDQRALIQHRYVLREADQTRLEQYLVAHAEGNPLYAGELLRTLEEEGILAEAEYGWQLGSPEQLRMPPLLRQVIEARLDRLSDEVRRLLEVAAVIGQEVPLQLWQQVSGASDEDLATAIEQSQAAHLIAEVGVVSRCRFRHALLRDVLRQQMVAPRRRVWHRRAAEVLMAAPDPDPDTVAYHLRQADDARAREWLIVAGERAQRAYAWLTAAERYEAALALLPDRVPSAADHGWLLLRLAWLLRLKDPSRSLTYVEGAQRVAALVGDRALAARAAYDHGLIGCQAGALRLGLAEMIDGAAALRDLSPEDRRWLDGLPSAMAAPDDTGGQGHLARFLALAGRFAEARDTAERALAEPPRVTIGALSGVPRAAAWAAVMLSQAAAGRPDDARAAAAAARTLYRASEHHVMLGATFADELLWVHHPYAGDRPDERRDLAAEAETALARASGAVEAARPGPGQLLVSLIEGDWPQARAAAEAGRKSNLNVSRPQRATWVLATIMAHQGASGAVRALIGEVLQEGPATDPGDCHFFNGLHLQRLAAQLALERLDLTAAHAWLQSHDRWLDWSGAILGRAEGAVLWAQYYNATGDHALARQQAEHAEAHASRPRQPLALIAVHRFLGRLDTEARHYSHAELHLQQSLALTEACAAPFERALTLLALAELRTAQGNSSDARALLTEVRRICAPLEAEPTLSRAEALASRIARTRPRRRADPAGLSAREAEVLGRVATGESNREVAEALVLSVRTVEKHLAHAYAKIGARGRADAAAYAARHGLLPEVLHRS